MAEIRNGRYGWSGTFEAIVVAKRERCLSTPRRSSKRVSGI
jgi:hypothetical protein